MRLRISHTTGYTYPEGAAASYNEARMTPMTTGDQMLLRSRLDVTPVAWTLEFRDYWGTAVTAFEVHDPHESLTVVATSTVDLTVATPSAEGVTWEGLADVEDELCELVTLNDWVDPPDALRATLADLRSGADTPADYVAAVAAMLHERIAYLSGVTAVTTTASDAWASGAGVCQDFAHLMIGALRAYRIPARYVSGYLHPDPEPVVGETVRGESHAWVEWWDGAWRGWDPTNVLSPTERHVVVARGRDYGDCPPLRGIYATDGESEMFVDVEITRLA